MDTLKIGGQDLPIAYGFGAIRQFEILTGKAVTALFDQESGQASGMVSDAIALIAAGLNNGARKAGLKHTYTVDSVADLLDLEENPSDVIAAAMAIVARSYPAGEEGEKKKAA